MNAKAKIRHTTYNVLLERYDSVEIGDARSNISTTLVEQQEKIDQARIRHSCSQQLTMLQTGLLVDGVAM